MICNRGWNVGRRGSCVVVKYALEALCPLPPHLCAFTRASTHELDSLAAGDKLIVGTVSRLGSDNQSIWRHAYHCKAARSRILDHLEGAIFVEKIGGGFIGSIDSEHYAGVADAERRVVPLLPG